jgi:hypothetical protein
MDEETKKRLISRLNFLFLFYQKQYAISTILFREYIINTNYKIKFCI